MEKTKLLYIGDYSNTGFGTVAKGFLRELSKRDDLDILQFGINYHDTDAFEEDWEIVPAGWTRWDNGPVADDPYGITRIDFFLKKFDPDIIFINNDYNVAKLYMTRPVKGNKDETELSNLAKHRALKVLYAPVDSEPIPPLFIEIAKMFDLNIAYTAWHRMLMAERDPLFAMMPVLYHGVDTDIYTPMEKSIAKQVLIDILAKQNSKVPRSEIQKRIEDKFLVLFVGANQFRKDLPCLFRAFALLEDDIDNAVLIPHTEVIPKGWNGWNLANLQYLTEANHVILMMSSGHYTEDEMNIFYNAADVLAYPTRGEGFGLPSFEAMATKTPVVATRFGPQEEFHNDDRGYFIDILDMTPKDIAGWSWFALPDHRSLYKWLKHVHDNPQEATEKAQRAFDWVQGFTWQNQANVLYDILSKLPRKTDADDVQATEANSD